jgi:hypothetical protein
VGIRAPGFWSVPPLGEMLPLVEEMFCCYPGSLPREGEAPGRGSAAPYLSWWWGFLPEGTEHTIFGG